MKRKEDVKIDLSVFSKRMEQVISRRGRSVPSIANDLNIATSTLTRYERGERMPSLDMLLLISSYFKVSIDWLVGNASKEIAILPDDQKAMIHAYMNASDEDKLAVNRILAKYLEKKK